MNGSAYFLEASLGIESLMEPLICGSESFLDAIAARSVMSGMVATEEGAADAITAAGASSLLLESWGGGSALNVRCARLQAANATRTAPYALNFSFIGLIGKESRKAQVAQGNRQSVPLPAQTKANFSINVFN